MPQILLFLLILFGAAGALAQGAGGSNERQAAREQRRTELRSALQARRQSEKPPESQGARVEPRTQQVRHLTPEERAEMRQQLRQQQIENRRVRP